MGTIDRDTLLTFDKLELFFDTNITTSIKGESKFNEPVHGVPVRFFYQSLNMPLDISKAIGLLDCEQCCSSEEECKKIKEKGECEYEGYEALDLFTVDEGVILPSQKDFEGTSFKNLEEMCTDEQYGLSEIYEAYQKYRKAQEIDSSIPDNICIMSQLSWTKTEYFELFLRSLPLALKSVGFIGKGTVILVIDGFKMVEAEQTLKDYEWCLGKLGDDSNDCYLAVKQFEI